MPIRIGVNAHRNKRRSYDANMRKNRTLKEIVGENIATILRVKKLSQPKAAAIAKKAGTPVNQTTISRVARAEFPATLDTIEAIANGLEVPPWQLLLESGTDHSSLELLRAWAQSGEQGRKLLALAAKGAMERDTQFDTSPGDAREGGDVGPRQPRRGRAS